MTLLSACAPRFDWRDYNAADFSCLFPGKVASVARPVNLDGTTLDMTQHAARVSGIAFVVGHVALPVAVDKLGAASDAEPTAGDREPPMPDRIVAAMRAAMVRNIEGSIAHEESVRMPASDSGQQAIEAVELTAHGQTLGEPVTMRARFAAQESRVWQIIVLGPRDEMESAQGREAVETFFLSVRLQAEAPSGRKH